MKNFSYFSHSFQKKITSSLGEPMTSLVLTTRVCPLTSNGTITQWLHVARSLCNHQLKSSMIWILDCTTECLTVWCTSLPKATLRYSKSDVVDNQPPAAANALLELYRCDQSMSSADIPCEQKPLEAIQSTAGGQCMHAHSTALEYYY